MDYFCKNFRKVLDDAREKAIAATWLQDRFYVLFLEAAVSGKTYVNIMQADMMHYHRAQDLLRQAGFTVCDNGKTVYWPVSSFNPQNFRKILDDVRKEAEIATIIQNQHYVRFLEAAFSGNTFMRMEGLGMNPERFHNLFLQADFAINGADYYGFKVSWPAKFE